MRVEPTGETVVAGRAAPGATVELLVNGRRHARVVADPSGLFALVPDPLPSGSHELVLQVPNGDGSKLFSTQTVTVVVADNGLDAPLVTVTAPGQPAVVLSRPDAQPKVASASPPASPSPRPGSAGQGASSEAPPRPDKPVGGAVQADPSRPVQAPAKSRPPIQIASVEVEGAGRLLVSASAAPAATVRLYLNDSFIAPAAAGGDGRVAFAIDRGIRPGSYRVRLDDIDPVSGQVRSRAEVPFEMPIELAGGKAPAPSGAAPATGREQTRMAAAGDDVVAGSSPEPRERTEKGSQHAGDAGASRAGSDLASSSAPPGPIVVIPSVSTTTVARGDSLWAISHRTYGDGWRYSVIYGANAKQIRNPDLIYPGQIFVLPAPSSETAKH
ncbi:LysM peptidoglycan-binding domain-containing protein [Enterovirga rhinocerotis]|uniref:LysM peptidoglycan-binding domain-containing protein n=1 Tax=Enterovirga rhinocerotis TaxID=1339210 RepID=UPI00105E1056|nr:LysM peptidoglycan-binding domain-containing protein [Enterovirga rhinocerotis]